MDDTNQKVLEKSLAMSSTDTSKDLSNVEFRWLNYCKENKEGNKWLIRRVA